MGKKRRYNKNKVAKDESMISIPVYISDPLPVDKDETVLFPYTQETMIDRAKAAFEKFNSSQSDHLIPNRSQSSTVEHGIKSIEVHEMNFNTDKSLILQVSAFQTNFIDGFYIDSSESSQHDFKKNDRICSDTYFIILYPKIYKNLSKNKNAAYWHVFLYADPSKDSKVIANLARYIMARIIQIPIRNVKSEKFMSDIRKTKNFTKVQINIRTFSDGDDNEPDYITRYKYKSSIKKDKNITIENVSSVDAIEALNDTSCFGEKCRRTLRFETAEQRVYSATQTFNEKITTAYEDSFNYSVNVPNCDVALKKIFELDYIKSKIHGLLTKYLIPTDIDD